MAESFNFQIGWFLGRFWYIYNFKCAVSRMYLSIYQVILWRHEKISYIRILTNWLKAKLNIFGDLNRFHKILVAIVLFDYNLSVLIHRIEVSSPLDYWLPKQLISFIYPNSYRQLYLHNNQAAELRVFSILLRLSNRDQSTTSEGT